MSLQGWKYYNHAMIPDGRPDEEPDLTPIKNGEIWSNVHEGGTPLLVRWTSDWDCGYETNWWYVIKDDPFNITALKSKRRYEINKGNKNFEIREILPREYSEELYNITMAAYESYPASYRRNIIHDKFIEATKKWSFYKTYGAFSREDGQLCGYAHLSREEKYINFLVLKVRPDKEKLAINAAIVNKILEDHREFLASGGYISDGERSILHKTAFQDYLEKYFGFRKAYCRLFILYNPKIAWLIKVLYPLRKTLLKFDEIGLIRKMNAVLKMEEIVRGQ